MFFDVGASTGPFSLYCALKSKAKVFSFEPEAQNYSVLEMNHYLNRKNMRHSITSLMIAIGDKSSLLPLYINRYGAGWAMKIVNKPVKRFETEKFGPVHIQHVIVESIDNLIEKYNLPFPRYLKIDADESEYEVVQGARKTLRSPTLQSVLIELIMGTTVQKKFLILWERMVLSLDLNNRLKITKISITTSFIKNNSFTKLMSNLIE